MAIKILQKSLNGLILLKFDKYSDSRGYFTETYNKAEMSKIGINSEFVQDNMSLSKRDVIRGLHFQWDEPLSKLIRVNRGKALFVELDIRKNSPSFGKYSKFELDENSDTLLWVPAGFANGFACFADCTEVLYKCDKAWNPKAEAAILWNDSSLGIDWGIDAPIVSDKDRNAFTFDEWLSKNESDVFTY